MLNRIFLGLMFALCLAWAQSNAGDYGISGIRMFKGAVSDDEIWILVDATSKDEEDWLYFYVCDGEKESLLRDVHHLVMGSHGSEFCFGYNNDDLNIDLNWLAGKTFIVKQYDSVNIDESVRYGEGKFLPAGELIDEKGGIFPQRNEILQLEEY